MSENGSENGSEARSVSDNGQSIGSDSAAASSGTPSTVDELKTRAQDAADAVNASTDEFEKSLNLYYRALNSFSIVLYSDKMNSRGSRVMNEFINDNDSSESLVKQLKEYHQNLIDWHDILKEDYGKLLKPTKGGSSRRRSIKFGKSKRKRPRKSSRRRKGRKTRRNRR